MVAMDQVRRRSARRRRLRWPRWSTVARHLVLVAVSTLILFPFLWVILISFRPFRDLTRLPPTLFPRVWTLAYGVMAEQDWPDEIPDGFQERYGLKRLRDDGQPFIAGQPQASEQASRFAEQAVNEIKRTIFPLHGL